MERARELIQSRIEEVQDPVQRILLQDVLVDVFGELLNYSAERFSDLERRIDGELCDPSRQYYIYTGVCKKDGVDSTSRCLFEVGAGGEHRQGYLGTLFLACEYPVVRRCLSETYWARVETDQGEYETTVSFRFCSAYLSEMRWLYRQFVTNGKPWHTVNCPFLYKLLDIEDRKGVVPGDAAVLRVEIAFGELSAFVSNDVVLVWNLQEECYKPDVDVAVVGKASVYNHRILLTDPGAGYLAMPEREELFTTVYSEGEISVRTERDAHKTMKLLRIAGMDGEKDHTSLIYPLQTNKRRMRHVDRQALLQPRCLWTRGEVERFLGSYEVFGEFELVDICPDMPAEMEMLDMNPFIYAHSLLKKKRKMTVILHPKDDSDIFRYEKMFFLISELQLCTEEYEWAGMLR